MYVLIDLLMGLAESITLEPPGTAGVGFEFFVDRPITRECHQVKYQNSQSGKWTLSALHGEHVLDNFRAKLAGDSGPPSSSSPRTPLTRSESFATTPPKALRSRTSSRTSCRARS